MSEHLRLAGVTRLSVGGARGTADVFLFDPHRLALPCWALALEGKPRATLLTLDRHFDWVTPRAPGEVPDRSAGLRAIDEHARWSLDTRNFDHILAACEADLVGEVFALARARPRETTVQDRYLDSRGREHRLYGAPTVDRISERFEANDPSGPAGALKAALDSGAPLLLDLDLDCFTSPSDADPTAILPWPEETIREFLLPPGSEKFWDAVLARTVAITIAREPYHVGGLIPGGRLFESFARVFFGELLRAPLP